MPAKSCGCGPTLAELLFDWPPEKLPELDSAIARLLLKSRDLREQINARTAFLSLPAEIISEISMMACEPVYEASDPHSFVKSRQLTTPLMLGKICRLWRHIVFRSPRLWNVIFLELRREPQLYKTRLQLLKSWLSRSGDLLLSIHLDELGREAAGWIENPPVEVFELLAGYSHRWLHVSTFLVRPCWEGLEKLPLPSLTTLAVRPPGDARPPTELRKANWRISYAPFLRDAYFVMFDKVAMELPMHQLTQIRMKSCMWQDCLSLLANAPNVVHCALLGLYSRSNDNPHAVIVLPYLSSLTVGSLSGVPLITTLLDCIMTPSLSQMHVIWGESRGSEPFASMGTFLSRSSCSLRELSFHVAYHRETCEQGLITMLADMESLEKLELSCKWGGKFEPVFYHLNPARPQHTPQYLHPSRVVLPNLRCFRYKGPMTFEIHHLTQMIDMRYRMSNDGEKNSQLEPVGREGHYNHIARPESFNIEILEMKRDHHYYTILCDYVGTLERLMEEHDGITFSFFDGMGDNISLQSLMPVMDPDSLADF